MSKKVLGIIIAVVVVLAGAGVGTYFYLTNTPKNKYLLSEKQSYDAINTYFSDRFKQEMELQDGMAESSYKAGVSLNAEVPGTLLESVDIPESMVNSSKIDFNVAHDPENNTSQIAINPTIADNEIGNMAWSADKEFQYIEAPLLESPLKFKNDAIIQGLEKLTGEKMSDTEGLTNETVNLNTLMSSTVTQADIDKITAHYLKFILEEINEDNFTKDSGKVDVLGKEEKLDSITMDLKAKDVKQLTIATLKEMKADKDIEKIISKADQSIDYKKELDTLIKDAENADEKDFPAIKSIIYVDGKDVQKRVITMEAQGEKVKIDLDTKIGKDIEIKAVFGADDTAEVVTLEGSSKGQGDVKDSYTINMQDSFKAVITNEESLKDKTRTDAMVVKVDADGQTFEVKYDQSLMTDVKNNEQTSKGVVAFDISGETVKLNIDTTAKLKEAFKVDVKDAKDVNEMTDAEVEKVQTDVSSNLMGIYYGLMGGL